MYDPTVSSVFCAMVPSGFGGSSSGLTGVSMISSMIGAMPTNPSTSMKCPTSLTRDLTKVFGILVFTAYMLMWSPL